MAKSSLLSKFATPAIMLVTRIESNFCLKEPDISICLRCLWTIDCLSIVRKVGHSVVER